MRHLRMVGLSFVAVFAIAAIAASSASALEWGKCEAKAGGNYTDSSCTSKAKPKGTGTFEWLKASQVAAKRVAEGKSKNVPFTGKSVGSGGVLATELEECYQEESPFEIFPGRYTRQACEEKGAARHRNGTLTVECTAEESKGEAEGTNKITKINVTFTGCLALGTIPCQNGAPGEITTETLKGKLGWITKSPKEVGVLLEPASGKKGTFAKFACPGLGVTTVVGVGNSKEGAAHTLSGCTQECPGTLATEEKNGGYNGVISPITPINKMTSTFTQEYKMEGVKTLEECPENIPNKFAGKHIDVLESQEYQTAHPNEGVMWGCAGEEITNVNTPEEEGEIKA